MKKESSSSGGRRDLQSLLDAIKSSDVVENRIQLLNELAEIDVSEKSELASLGEAVTTFWEDFTCLDISQCMLNKHILRVAKKYLESDLIGCLGQFLALGTKASTWCGKHLRMTLMTTDESQEEHSCFFFQLLLDMLSYSSASFSALTKYPISTDKELRNTIERFILQQLVLANESMSELKRIQAFGLEVLKMAQLALDAAIRLCRVYADGVNWDLYSAGTEKDRNGTDNVEIDKMNHVINITRCTVEKLCGLGILAGNDGGSLVSVLNLSWKGVVSLLQLGKGALAVELNVADIILTLISLANDSLRCAADAWSGSLMEEVSVTEAKRIFLPVKFYLINAARIISQYPCQAFTVYKKITLCILMILSFRILLSKGELLKFASQALGEVLEPTSLHLLNSLLNSAQVKQEDKLQILDWLFNDETHPNLSSGDSICKVMPGSMDAIFSVGCDAMHGARILLLGRVALFLNLLKSAPDIEDGLTLGLAQKLRWLLNILADEDVYSSILILQIPTQKVCGQVQKWTYQSMFFCILHSLRTFMIAVSSTHAWDEMECFLLENFFHPHFLCWEIIMELWCFMVRHAETDMLNDTIDKLCILLNYVMSSESVLLPDSALRKLARSICMLLKYGSQSLVDRVYSSIVGSSISKLSSNMYLALLMEGFPLKLLSEKLRSSATQKIVTEYFGFLENCDDGSYVASTSGVFGAPVFALSAALQSLQVSISDTDMRNLKLLVAIMHKYRSSVDALTKDNYRMLLAETLHIISYMKNLHASNEMEGIILELQKLFISGKQTSDTKLFECKPSLAIFMAGLGHVELAETDNNVKSSAVWELYHMLLRERHWAFIHLAITAFGYFAARTSCNQLWRFVPQDAALSFDLESGIEANKEMFMSELKAFLEKEMACLTMTASPDQLELLAKDGLVLKQMLQKIIDTKLETAACDPMDIDDEIQARKRRKLPDGISKGVQLVQSGLKVVGDGIAQLHQSHMNIDLADFHDKLLTHFSRLEDVIAHLVTLTGSV